MVLIVERFDFQTIRLHSVWFPIVLNTTSIMRLRYKWGHLSMTTFSEYYTRYTPGNQGNQVNIFFSRNII